MKISTVLRNAALYHLTTRVTPGCFTYENGVAQSEFSCHAVAIAAGLSIYELNGWVDAREYYMKLLDCPTGGMCCEMGSEEGQQCRFMMLMFASWRAKGEGL